MALALATAIWIFAGVYAGLGLLFAIYFAFSRVGRIDPAAKAGTLGFRILILPGLTAFWPLFLYRLFKGASVPPTEKNAHRQMAEARGRGGL